MLHPTSRIALLLTGFLLFSQNPAPADQENLSLIPAAPVMSGGEHAEEVSKTLSRRTSENDQWTSEVTSENIAHQLAKLAEAIKAKEDLSKLSTIGTTFSCLGLKPPTEVAYQERELTVRRQIHNSEPPPTGSKETGGQRLRECLNELFPADRESLKIKFKVVGIRPTESKGEVLSDVLYHSSLLSDQSRTEQIAKWTCRWKTGAPKKPTLLSIKVSDFEETTRTGPQPLFQEISQWVFEGQDAYEKQLVHGVPYWQSQIQATLGQELFGHHGIAVGDVNGDLLDDIYVCQPGGLPNRLFVREPDGRAIDRSAELNLNILDSTNSAGFADLDNDGDQDLLALANHSLYVFENNNKGNFHLAATVPITSKNALSFSIADYDQDGLLDLYVCGYAYPTGKARVPRPYHDSNNGYPNVLLRNKGDWSFEDVTERVGLDQNNQRFSFASAFEDFDNDGDLDLYVANDYGRNNLYQNQDGKFKDIAAQAGVEDISAGMAVVWADVNRDGWMDLHVSNMFSSAGNRVTYQRNFRENAEDSTKGLFQRHARGNSLFLNNGDGTFQDASVDAGITMGRWAWGARFTDLNNDGFQDLVVTNGNITGKDDDDL